MPIAESVIKEILSGYEERRKAAENQQKLRQAEIYSRLPEVEQIDHSLDQFGLNAMRLYLKHHNQAAEAVEELKHSLQEMNARKKELLTAAGYPQDYLELHYTCPLCKDTGYVNYEKCSCFKQQLISRQYEHSGMKRMIERQNFASFDPSLFSTSPIPGETLSPRQNMAQVCTEVRRLIADFGAHSDQNFLFSGSVGTGKTFLCSCMAAEVMAQGYQVLYTTAYDLCRVLEQKRFNHSEETAESVYETADMLIIDDLGTEFINSVTISELFHVINQRMLDARSTVISTNLTLSNLTSAYGDRLGSRIANGFRIFRFYGPDLRMEKRRRSQF